MEELWKAFWEMKKDLQRLEREVETLRAELQHNRGVHIRRVIYRIDSLHVRTVRGTLHVGLTTPAEGSGLSEAIPEFETGSFGNLGDAIERASEAANEDDLPDDAP